MNISDIMKRNVKTIDSSVTLECAAKKMSRNKIGSLVVLSRRRVSGIITMFDIARADPKYVRKTAVKNLMSRNLVTVDSSTSLINAIDIMKKNKIHRIPVIDNGKLCGIVTAADLAEMQRNIFMRAERIGYVRGFFRSRVAF